MRRIFCTVIAVVSSAWIVTASPSVNISGTVTKTGGGPLKDVTVTLAKVSGISATTDAEGKFVMGPFRTIRMNSPEITPLEFTLKGKTILFSSASGKISGSVDLYSGNGRRTASIQFVDLQPGTRSVTLPALVPGLNILRVTIDNTTFNCPILRVGNEVYLKNDVSNAAADGSFTISRQATTAAAVDTLIAKKAGYVDKKTPIEAYSITGVTISMDSAVQEPVCQIPPMPSFSDFKEIKELPDPFKMMDGTRMTKKSQWDCRREEIKALAQKCIYGWKPGKPDKMEATYSGGTLTMKCTVGSKTGSFSVKISGNSGEGPYPAIITIAFGATYGVPSGVATITFNEQSVAKSDVNGRDPPAGMFYNLYPDYKSTGALVAWAWGVSRMIDALEQPDIKAQAKIDPTRLGVTGCSYAGKAAFAIGVWDRRIALTLPVESGAGGVAAWRIAEQYAPPGKPAYPASGCQDGCQYLYETYDEATWLGDSINMFRKKEYTLPIDMHQVGALIAPRGFLGLGYSTKWICAQGEWGTGLAMHMVYDALGYPDNCGMLIGQAPSHCSKSTKLNEQSVYNAFVKKFLQGDATANTSKSVALRNDANYPMTDSKYIPWTKPTLEGEYPEATRDKE